MKAKRLSAIGQALLDHRLTHKQVASLLSVTPQAVGRWARGETDPTPTKLEELSRVLGTSSEALRHSQAKGAGLIGEMSDDEIAIPVVAISPDVSPGDKDLVRMLKVSKNWILSRVPGASLQSLQLINPMDDSMSPTIPSTGFVIVDTSITRFDRDGVFIFENVGQRYIKRVQRQIDGSLKLLSDNPRYPIQTVAASDAGKIKVVGLCLISCTAVAL